MYVSMFMIKSTIMLFVLACYSIVMETRSNISKTLISNTQFRDIACISVFIANYLVFASFFGNKYNFSMIVNLKTVCLQNWWFSLEKFPTYCLIIKQCTISYWRLWDSLFYIVMILTFTWVFIWNNSIKKHVSKKERK